jgi:hypothetical protein
MLNKISFISLIALSISAKVFPQEVKSTTRTNSKQEETTNLFKEIVSADSLLFNSFNSCDSLTYKEFFTDDLEFYHDTGGLSVSLKNELQSFKDMCARGTHMRRELVKSSLEIHLIKDYGAIQVGSHRFYYTNKGQKEILGGTYKFLHIWKKVNGKWKISRIVSYGHKS